MMVPPVIVIGFSSLSYVVHICTYVQLLPVIDWQKANIRSRISRPWLPAPAQKADSRASSFHGAVDFRVCFLTSFTNIFEFALSGSLRFTFSDFRIIRSI
jgi:hypothetical protein